MLACSAYELKDPTAIAKLRHYLDQYPDTPHANRIYCAYSVRLFLRGNYDEALALFNSSRLDLLSNEERDDMTYQLATCYLKARQCQRSGHLVRDITRQQAVPNMRATAYYYISYISATHRNGTTML